MDGIKATLRYICAMDATKRGVFIIHFCVVLWGFTAVLGAMIQISSVPLVLWRVSLAGVVLAVMVAAKGWQRLPALVWRRLTLIGLLVGVHWVGFYASIKLANASIGVVTISTCAFFTAIFEPFILRTRIRWKDVMVGILIIPAMLLIIGSVDIKMQQGFWVGIGAAALVGVFTSLTKRVMTDHPDINVVQATMIQMMVISVFLTACLPVFMHFSPGAAILPTDQSDWICLILLAVFCTVVPFTLSMHALKSISPFTSSLALNLEPVYGILFAIVLLREDKELNVWFYLGVLLLFAIVFGHTLWQRRKSITN
jgi:drug/metabolite transporter (DMT)-like permease